MPAPRNTFDSTLYVSTIDISPTRGSRRTIGCVTLRKNGESLKDVLDPIYRDGVHRIEFSPPRALNPEDISVSINYGQTSRLLPWKRRADIPIDVDLRDLQYMHDRHGVKSYRKEASGVVVKVTGHQSVLANITPKFDFGSRFRILLIGNSGVGKSSLVHTVFGVEGVHASETTQGTADINEEFISPLDKRFVIHDSEGFDAGDERNLEIVKNFVAQRMAMPQPEDQLHAIWVCLETPYAGGRLFEGGVENFLQRRIECLGQIPLMVVFTKVDRLDLQLELDLPAYEDREQHKSKYMDKFCICPLRKAAGSDIPHVSVSVAEGYIESLSTLVQTTHKNVVEYVRKNSRP